MGIFMLLRKENVSRWKWLPVDWENWCFPKVPTLIKSAIFCQIDWLPAEFVQYGVDLPNDPCINFFSFPGTRTHHHIPFISLPFPELSFLVVSSYLLIQVAAVEMFQISSSLRHFNTSKQFQVIWLEYEKDLSDKINPSNYHLCWTVSKVILSRFGHEMSFVIYRLTRYWVLQSFYRKQIVTNIALL